MIKILGSNNKTDQLVLASTMNVGIGTNDPQGLLHICNTGTGTAAAAAKLIINSDSDNTNENSNPYLILAQDSNSMQGGIHLDHRNNLNIVCQGNAADEANNDYDIKFKTLGAGSEHFPGVTIPWQNATTKMIIKNNGDVGIGINNPSSTLHVNGTTLLSSKTDIAGTLTLSKSTGTGLSVTAGANIGGATTLANTLSVGDNVTLASTLNVGSELSIGKAVTLASTLNIGSELSVGKAVTLESNLNVAGDILLYGNKKIHIGSWSKNTPSGTDSKTYL